MDKESTINQKSLHAGQPWYKLWGDSQRLNVENSKTQVVWRIDMKKKYCATLTIQPAFGSNKFGCLAVSLMSDPFSS
jgi:hypothetical protein